MRATGTGHQVYRDLSDRPMRITGVCRDITDRRRLKERFRSAVEGAPAAMVMIDRAGTIVLANDKVLVLAAFPGIT